MSTPQEKLAASLEALRDLQARGVAAIRSSDMEPSQRRLLLAQGFLEPVMKGWYRAVRPDEAGETSTWFAEFWRFCADYLNARFGDEWSLSPEQSLDLHAGNAAVPDQLLVRAPKGRNRPTPLIHGSSILELRAALSPSDHVEIGRGLRAYALPAALVAASPRYYERNPTDARIALCAIRDAADVLAPLLEGGHSKVAGRLAGAFRNVGRAETADAILAGMRAAGYRVHEIDPFARPVGFPLPLREPSPYCNRLRLMWRDMRETVLRLFPAPPDPLPAAKDYLAHVDETYVKDAYHSLSIEAYRVTPELIERVRTGAWNPEGDRRDRNDRNALAARGYWQAFQAVRTSVAKVLEGAPAGDVAASDHRDWYRELFSPGVVAGIVEPADLAGYRDGQVYIRGSRHTPPDKDAVRDCMPVLFELLGTETDAAARAVLGHFGFVYVHPYMDGNGRLGRFLMNAMLASGGYPWTVIPSDLRDDYMAGLEAASVRADIGPFAEFLGALVRADA